MSTIPINFHSTPATNTIYHSHLGYPFNIWLVISTGLVFFAILAWFNFFLAVYNYFIGVVPDSGVSNGKEIAATLGFAILWSLLIAGIIVTLISCGFLDVSPEETFNEAVDLGPM